MEAFVREMRSKPPAAASIADVKVEPALCEGLAGFTIREGTTYGTAYRSHFAGSAHLRRLPSGMFDPEQSAISISLHKLHELRSSL